MRRITPWIAILIIAVMVSGCSLSFGGQETAGEPTLTDAQMQTQISSLLTAQPTATMMPKAPVTNTPSLPTAAPAEATATLPPPEATATGQPTATEVPTNAAPEATATEPSGDSQVGGGGPTPTPPPTNVPQGATATVSPDDPRSRLGSPSATDFMNNSTDWLWPTGYNQYSAIDFTNGTMVLTSLDTISGWRLANPEGHAFGDLYIEATIKTGSCKGNDQYGIMARMPVLKEADQGYLLGFTCDGRYSFRSWDGKVGEKGKMTRLVDWTASSAIKTGPDQTNRMGLMLVGTRMRFYANGVYLGETTASAYPSGYFGLFVSGQQTDDFKIIVDEMSYWVNPKP